MKQPLVMYPRLWHYTMLVCGIIILCWFFVSIAIILLVSFFGMYYIYKYEKKLKKNNDMVVR